MHPLLFIVILRVLAPAFRLVRPLASTFRSTRILLARAAQPAARGRPGVSA